MKKKQHKILIVDDEQNIIWVLKKGLEKKSYLVHTASSGEEALEQLTTNQYLMMFSDIFMGEIDGLKLLEQARKISPDLKVVMMTAQDTMNNTIEAMRLEAYDYITKPFNFDEIYRLVDKAKNAQLVAPPDSNLSGKQQEAGSQVASNASAIIGKSKRMQEIFKIIGKSASSGLSVLITGESGTGKEMVASTLHQYSQRKDQPFICINCAAISRELLESELFGHERGAFTGAIETKTGKFQQADGGTLFLDEIGDMSFNMQVKLLRVLQERCFERVGSNQTIQCNVRILAATHRDLGAMIEEGTFRHDLYYRLNVFPIAVPPLREHLDDLPELVAHFLERFKNKGMTIPRFTKTALEALQGYSWPGNVRELENILERLAITHGGRLVSARDLPCPIGSPLASAETAEEISFLLGDANDKTDDDVEAGNDPALDLPDEGFDLKAHMQALEKQFILQALERANGTVTQAAKLLGLQRTTLAEKMKKLQMA